MNDGMRSADRKMSNRSTHIHEMRMYYGVTLERWESLKARGEIIVPGNDPITGEAYPRGSLIQREETD